VSGFGAGINTSQSIHLITVPFNATVHRSYSGNTTSGVLTVTSGTTVVAKINMVGNYTTTNFQLSADSSGYVQITDPSNSASNTANSSTVTSGGSNGASFIDKASTFTDTPGSLWAHDRTGLTDIGFGGHGAKHALLGNYMATSFVTAADGHGGTLNTEASQTANQLLATPHAG
jgi:hypothetical protein